MPMVFKGRRYDVTIDDEVLKPGLAGFSIDGKHRGTFRTGTDAYRYLLADQAHRFPLSMSPQDVAERSAQIYLEREDERRQRKK